MSNILHEHTLDDMPEITDDALAEITLILEMQRNFSMAIYKDKCMKRRIAIRMRSCRCLDASAYCNLLRHSDHEIDQLQKTLTIHVSQFFRTPSMFDKLRDIILPDIFNNTEMTPLVFLSLGCAGGEEAYSLAIILQEQFAAELIKSTPKICALDIDADILKAATAAEYNEDRLKDLPDHLRARYFAKNGSRMQLCTKIREMVVFQQQNIIDIATFEKCHIVLCRNTLIYFTRADQEKILLGIAHILPTGGILILGKSEALVGEVRKLFVTVCPVERIYRKL